MKAAMRFLSVLAVASCATAQLGVLDLFQVDLDENGKGPCHYYAGHLQDLVNDAAALGNSGSVLVDDYAKNVPEARRLLDSYFHVDKPPLSADQLTAIQTRFRTVRNFLFAGGKYNGGERSNKPFLFCYHNWLVRKDMSSEALDVAGESFPNVFTGEPMRMDDIEEYTEEQEDQADANGVRLNRVFPYWSDNHKSYIFDVSYGGPTTGYCSKSTNLAATQHVLNPSSITLCPKSLGTRAVAWTSNNLNTATYRGLHTVPPVPITRAQVARGNAGGAAQKLDAAVTPTAITFFHELFHLIIGNADTYPNVGEVYDLFVKNGAQVIGLSYDLALVNPESFALAAVAYDYTVNWPANAAGDRIEFYSGFTTQG